ncbi:hypothetical protein D910_00810, partial [Dendroctonus ponderosae]
YLPKAGFKLKLGAVPSLNLPEIKSLTKQQVDYNERASKKFGKIDAQDNIVLALNIRDEGCVILGALLLLVMQNTRIRGCSGILHLIDIVNDRFRKYGGLDENISIDESMIPYYGKHYAKRYIRGKPIRFGLKYWAICTSSGYLVSFEIYTRKSQDNSDKRGFGLGGDIIQNTAKKMVLANVWLFAGCWLLIPTLPE